MISLFLTNVPHTWQRLLALGGKESRFPSLSHFAAFSALLTSFYALLFSIWSPPTTQLCWLGPLCFPKKYYRMEFMSHKKHLSLSPITHLVSYDGFSAEQGEKTEQHVFALDAYEPSHVQLHPIIPYCLRWCAELTLLFSSFYIFRNHRPQIRSIQVSHVL